MLQEWGEARTQVTALEASKAVQQAKIHASESHERECIDESRRLEHQQAAAGIEKGRHEAQNVESMKAVTHPKAEHENTKEPFGVFKGWASANGSEMRSASGIVPAFRAS